jgi:hypothetical protein
MDIYFRKGHTESVVRVSTGESDLLETKIKSKSNQTNFKAKRQSMSFIFFMYKLHKIGNFNT